MAGNTKIVRGSRLGEGLNLRPNVLMIRVSLKQAIEVSITRSSSIPPRATSSNRTDSQLQEVDGYIDGTPPCDTLGRAASSRTRH